MPELVIILVIIVLVFGVGKLPLGCWIWPLGAQPDVSFRLGPLACPSTQYPFTNTGVLPCRS
ncbi:MAG TPA: hypothetical protein VM075_05905 [Anaerolineae bacterium]|nr:hypothetical protein [Anaerolineae bacterium]